MNTDQFESLLRAFTAGSSRRGVLAGLTSALLVASPQAFSDEHAVAKRKHRRKRKNKKKNKKKSSPPSVTCTPSCAGKVCGDDGCGGTCGIACGGGKSCLGGSCLCPSGQEDCRGTCIPDTAACCTNADCAGGQICDQFQCVTGRGTCPLGTDSCAGAGVTCNGDPFCVCLQSTAGETRCGKTGTATECGSCDSDADCAELLPNVPGAFCILGGGTFCNCDGAGFCLGPCPN